MKTETPENPLFGPTEMRRIVSNKGPNYTRNKMACSVLNDVRKGGHCLPEMTF